MSDQPDNQTKSPHRKKITGRGKKSFSSARTVIPNRITDNVWIYGRHSVTALIANPNRKIHRLVVTESGLRSLGAMARSFSNQESIEVLSKESLENLIPPNAVHQGFAVLAEPLPNVDLVDLIESKSYLDKVLFIALDQVNDPQNLGAVLRSAAGFGCNGIIVPDKNTPNISGTVAKAASGALEMVPIIRVVNLSRSLQIIKKHGFWVVGMDLHGDILLSDTEFPNKCVLTMGSEGRGLRPLTRKNCDLIAQIPLKPEIQSLNLSATAAIGLYEWSGKGTKNLKA